MDVTCARKLSPELRDQVIALLGGHPFKHAIWAWQFEQGPDPDRARLILAQDAAGDVQGFNGSLPVRVQVGGAQADAHWSCDFIVARAARAHGLGTAMKHALARECEIIMALGISDAADRVHRSLGWVRGATIPKYARTQRVRRWRDLARIGLQVASGLVHERVRRPGYAAVSSEIVDAHHLPPEAACVWDRVAAEYPNAVVRDAAYLDWRYGRHPLMRYQAIILRESGAVTALAFFWSTPGKAVLVDYVGPRVNDAVLHEVVRAFVRACRSSAVIECSTTHVGLQLALESFGFLTWRSVGTIFNVYPATRAGPGREWFLMGGDSDGDMLTAARAGRELTVECWSEREFFAAREQWTDLLGRSNANRLFLSWEWMSAWWSAYAHRNDLTMHCLAARDRQDRLVGIAPLYAHRTNARGLFSRRVQFMGNIWRGRATMRTEYLEFIVDRSCAGEAIGAILDALGAGRVWDDCVLTDLDQQSAAYQELHKHPLARECYFRYVARHTGYGIDIVGTWNSYLQSLSGNQRRKLFLQRRQLAARGPVSVEWFDATRFEEFADRLDRLHVLRWGTPFFREEMRAFHRRFLDTLGDSALCHASILKVGDHDVSALYNVRVGGREYNLQGGFDEQFSRGLSIALLHLGYVVEQAFQDGIERVDLLVGGGKKGDFKGSISKVIGRSAAIHLLRTPLRKQVHKLYDRMRKSPVRSATPGPSLSARAP